MSVKTSRDAKLLSVSATFLSLAFMVPPVLIGAAAKSSEEAAAVFGNDTSVVLPAVIKADTPYWVSLIAPAAIR